jgi:hypothetical protein
MGMTISIIECITVRYRDDLYSAHIAGLQGDSEYKWAVWNRILRETQCELWELVEASDMVQGIFAADIDAVTSDLSKPKPVQTIGVNVPEKCFGDSPYWNAYIAEREADHCGL